MKHKINGTAPKLKKVGRAYRLTDKQKAWIELNKNAYRAEIAKRLGISRNTLTNLMKRESITYKSHRKKSQTEKDRAKQCKAYATEHAHYIFANAITYFFPDWLQDIYTEEILQEIGNLCLEQRFSPKSVLSVVKSIINLYGKDIACEMGKEQLNKYADDFYLCVFPVEAVDSYKAMLEGWAYNNFYLGDDVVNEICEKKKPQLTQIIYAQTQLEELPPIPELPPIEM